MADELNVGNKKGTVIVIEDAGSDSDTIPPKDGWSEDLQKLKEMLGGEVNGQ